MPGPAPEALLIQFRTLYINVHSDMYDYICMYMYYDNWCIRCRQVIEAIYLCALKYANLLMHRDRAIYILSLLSLLSIYV